MNNKLENNNSFLGFTDNRTALQAGKIEKILTKKFNYDGIIMERRDAMLMDLRAGKTPDMVEENVNGKKKKSYRLNFIIAGGMFDGAKVFNEITKTEYDFCLYLIENDLVSEERVDAYIKAENEKAKAAIQAEEEARKAEEEAEAKEEAENEAFRAWLRSSAEMYEGTTKANLLEGVYIDKYGEFNFARRYAAYELLVCIDNIENERCRHQLMKRLITRNKASRKVFECVTGLKLPKNNKETQEFLNNVQKSDYKEMIPYKARSKNEKPEEAQDEAQDYNLKVFYILEFDPQDNERKPEYHRILAEPITKKGFDCFIHEMPDGRFGISSVECGMRLADGDTKQEAIKALKRAINKVGDVKLRKHIQEAVKRFGASPASQKVAKIA